MPLAPRPPREKLTDKLPPVRLTSDERQAIDWLTRRMGKKAGAAYTLSDMLRAVLAEALRGEVKHAESEGEDVPEVVRRVL